MEKCSLRNRKAGMTHVCSPFFVLFLLILESLSLVSWNCCNSVIYISMLSKSHYFVVYNVSTCWSVYSPNVALLCDVCVRRRCVVEIRENSSSVIGGLGSKVVCFTWSFLLAVYTRDWSQMCPFFLMRVSISSSTFAFPLRIIVHIFVSSYCRSDITS